MGREEGSGYGTGGFALLVVLFILLIIIGTAYTGGGGYGGYGGGYYQSKEMQSGITPLHLIFAVKKSFWLTYQ